MPSQPQPDKTKVKKTATETDLYCRRCHCVNNSQNKTCQECDARLEVGTESAKCVECGEPLQTNARYCIKYDCGADQRVYEPPVAWLLGRQLIASFKSTLVYTAFGTKIDARDWMDAKVYSFDRRASGQARETFKKLYPDQPESAPVELVIAEPAQEESWRQTDEFWFDYISDTGDGMKATYSIAYLSLSNLWVSAAFAARAEGGTSTDGILRAKIASEVLKKRTSPEYLEEREKKRKAPRGENSVELDHEVETGEGELKQLPRGEFLLVGGDTCYHLSDYASLHTRFQTPFDWAYRDLDEDLQKVNRRIDNVDDRATGKNRRPLFGIPGNHDYYDMLDGFRRQFRLPVRSRSEDKVYANDDLSAAQLMSRGFRRLQQASYLALRLPFKWMLWGLDTEVGKIDERQRDFFNSVRGRGTPERLIVATSAPTTVFGKTASRDDEKSSRAFFQLNLRRCFLPRAKWEEDEKKKWQENGNEVLEPSQIRLDISGDVHQYARYWGPPSRTSHLARSDNPTAKLEEAPNYASVVSGLGGAFHHPSTTYADEIREQALYPSEDESRKEVAKAIFNPIKVFKGGGIWVVGGVIALLLTFAAMAGQSSRQAIHNLIFFTAFNLTEPERYQFTVTTTAPTPEPTPTPQPATEQPRPQVGSQAPPVPRRPSSLKPTVISLQPDKVAPSIIWRSLGVAEPTWKPEFAAIQPGEAGCEDGPKFLWGKCSVKWPPDFLIGMVMLLSTVGVIIVTFVLSERAYKKSQRQDESNTLNPKPPEEQARDLRAIVKRVNLTLWVTFLINIGLAIVGVFSIMPYRDFITPFGNSLWVLLTIIWAVTSIIFSIRYSDWLFEQASKRKVGNRDWVITFGLSIAVVVSLAVGLGLFGKNNLPAYLVSDILLVTVVLATFFLLLYAAFSMGGQFQKGWKKAGMLFIGFFHWLLQLGVALLLIKKGTWLTVVLALLVVLGFIKVGKYLMSENRRWRWKLLIAWVVFGGIILGLPPLIYQILRPYWQQGWVQALFFPHVFDQMPGSFASYEWWGGGWWNSLSPWWILVPLVIAFVFGALLSCVWVGWYFAVCLGFNGHNNEAGGASRIEHFKQFIRFRLRPNDLTGYVIAIDDPEEDGGKLEPKLIDIFHLKAIEPSESKSS
ncbi:MAG: hypothetical protein ND866_02765 [Pyrinomonadaceae bacterium]|nr:hypothetical protein [Pyrinomonadaceae bacterium]